MRDVRFPTGVESAVRRRQLGRHSFSMDTSSAARALGKRDPQTRGLQTTKIPSSLKCAFRSEVAVKTRFEPQNHRGRLGLFQSFEWLLGDGMDAVAGAVAVAVARTEVMSTAAAKASFPRSSRGRTSGYPTSPREKRV